MFLLYLLMAQRNKGIITNEPIAAVTLAREEKETVYKWKNWWFMSEGGVICAVKIFRPVQEVWIQVCSLVTPWN